MTRRSTTTRTYIIIRNLDGVPLGRNTLDSPLVPVPEQSAYVYDSVQSAGEEIVRLGLSAVAYVDEMTTTTER
jgi:hypothetical protein